MKVYVSKESKKEETKSTAYSFLLVSILGFIALILFATGVLPVHVADYMKIMLCIVMGVMLLIFFVIGIVSLRQLKTLGTQAEKENDLSSEIISWFTSTYSAKDIDESMDEEVFDQDLYFKRRFLSKQYPDLEETFLDHLVEELYGNLFEENTK